MTYYVRYSVVPVDEDLRWEFKGHRNMSADEIPAWRPDGSKISPLHNPHEFARRTSGTHRTRQPISRNINAFLNSGRGGTVLMGVLDCGRVEGMALSDTQKDHLMLALEDSLNRFDPPVPLGLVRIAFRPVVESLEALKNFDEEASKVSEASIKERFRAHRVRASVPCWCEGGPAGKDTSLYVVEIHVKALHPAERDADTSALLKTLLPADDTLTPLHRLSWPSFVNEDRNVFIRFCASVVKYTREEVQCFNDLQAQAFAREQLRKGGTKDQIQLWHEVLATPVQTPFNLRPILP